MGNEQSQLPGLELEEKAVEVTDFWSHHSASVNSGNVTSLSVFVGEPLIGGSLWVSQTPLEKASKNLMIHRHPCLLKYVSSWSKGSKFYLAVEDVKPLSHVLPNQNMLQICIGLHSILKALSFLHDKANSSHNNVCTASIYVSKDGNWKLGGLEYLCRFQDITNDYMNKTKVHRYDKCIDPNEEKNLGHTSNRKDFIDIYAYAELAKEILKNKSDDDIPLVDLFKDMCKNDLQNTNIVSRPKLNALLDHPFFSHEFISIHSFLTELPLKNDQEKTDFFSGLKERLSQFDEELIGNQLTSLLLSRMVLLNKTAQQNLLPYILCPTDHSDCDRDGLFSTSVFKRCIAPKLLEIFCVRDAQIRLLLLQHFSHFMAMFTNEELQSCILPELLVGIKDTNDHLVSVTLRALADLVTILGAATVIGGKRAKLFNDGRPTSHVPSRKQRRSSSKRNEDIAIPIQNINRPLTPNMTSAVVMENVNQILELPERPSPDGEEGETSTEETDQIIEDDIDNWEDWDTQAESTMEQINLSPSMENLLLNSTDTSHFALLDNTNLQPDLPVTDISTLAKEIPVNNHKKKSLIDINELDIKNQRDRNNDLENFNFFQDMEPVIESTTKFFIEETNVQNATKTLDLSVKGEGHEEGWGEEEW